MAYDDALRSPDALLRHAAAADAALAQQLLARIGLVQLLELVVTQAELAVDDERPRAAGIDAVGDLARVAIEVMDLPQDAELDLDDGEAVPTVTGWELVTVAPKELAAATLTLPVSPWVLALVAFADRTGDDGRPERRVVAAAADGRLVGATLRPCPDEDDAEVLRATVTREPTELHDDAAMALALLAALQSAARGR